MTLKIHPRSEWTDRPWAGTTYSVPALTRTEFLTHYEGGSPTHDTGAAAMRAIDAGHRANGWAGIGYNFVVMLDGSVWEGRGWALVGAHCPDHNRIGIGSQIHLGGAQHPTPAALAAQRALYDEACRRSGHRLRMMGHRDGYATECPGSELERWVRDGMKVAGAPATPLSPPASRPGVPAPTFPLSSGWYFGPESGPRESVSGFHGHRTELAQWQAHMILRGWDLGPSGADGLYGSFTESATRGFQREKRLTVDGLIGAETWRAAWALPIT